jgi:hypothetical protein
VSLTAHGVIEKYWNIILSIKRAGSSGLDEIFFDKKYYTQTDDNFNRLRMV